MGEGAGRARTLYFLLLVVLAAALGLAGLLRSVGALRAVEGGRRIVSGRVVDGQSVRKGLGKGLTDALLGDGELLLGLLGGYLWWRRAESAHSSVIFHLASNGEMDARDVPS